MTMGITQALKLQEGPIDALAKLPQQQLIQMAQQGRISADVLPVILNEKAEMAQQAANMQALQQPQQPSVTEKNMAINAQAEAQAQQQAQAQQMQQMQLARLAQQPRDSGIANLPVSEDMYGGGDYAGGGIVAFDNGGMAGTFDAFMSGEQPTGAMPAMPEVPEELVGKIGLAQVKDIRSGRYGFTKQDILRAFGYKPPVAPVTPAAAAPAAAPAAVPRVAAPRAAAPKPTVAETPQEPELDLAGFKKKYGLDQESPELAAIRAKLAAMGGESKLDREHAANMALLQAGLGMMAGTSPYAFTNIGAGGMKGAEAYASSIKDIKAAEKDLFKMQAELAKADQARNDGNIKAFMDHQEKAKDYALKLRKAGVDEKVAEAQIKYYGRPGTYEELGQAAERYPWLKERFTTGAENIEMKVRKDAEAFVNNPMLAAQDPKYKELAKKAKGGDKKAQEELTNYRTQLYNDYITRNMPGGKATGSAGGKTLQWTDIQ